MFLEGVAGLTPTPEFPVVGRFCKTEDENFFVGFHKGFSYFILSPSRMSVKMK